MKTNKFFLLPLVLVILSRAVDSQTLLVDDFNYPPIDSLNGTGSWFLSGLNSPYNIRVVTPGLTYAPGFAGSGIGNTAFIYNQPNGDICLKNFTTQTSGALYMAFMLRVDSVGANAAAGYNIGFDQSGGATNLNTRVYLRRVSSSSFNIGIAKTTGGAVYKNAVYQTNTTYVIVVKYTFVAGMDNDSAKVFIFSSSIPAVEPTAADTFDVAGTDMVDNGQVFLSNCYAQGNALVGTTVKYDGIRIGTTWQGAIMTPVTKISNETPERFRLEQNYPNPFNPMTVIRYQLIVNGFVSLKVYDLTGREVAAIVNESQPAGEYEARFDGSHLSSGVYFYQLRIGNYELGIDYSETKKMNLIK